MLIKHFPIVIILIWVFLFQGCYKLEPLPQATLTESHKKFVDICKKDYALDVRVFPRENSVWIYLPIGHKILDWKVNDKGPESSDKPSEKRTVLFVDGKFTDGVFRFNYDIAQARSYAKSYGYDSTYTEEYQVKQHAVFTAIYRSYLGVEMVEEEQDLGMGMKVKVIRAKEKDAEDADGAEGANKEKAPDFFMIVIADIENGMELSTLSYWGDLKRGMTDQSFREEYLRRTVTSYPIGDKEIVGDKAGRHLSVHDITWSEFLTKQIVYKIEFKYKRSAFAPEDNDAEEIKGIIQETFEAYGFTDYTSVELHDLAAKKTVTFDKSELSSD